VAQSVPLDAAHPVQWGEVVVGPDAAVHSPILPRVDRVWNDPTRRDLTAKCGR